LAYFPILADAAGLKQGLTYGELVFRARTTYRGNTAVQKAIAASTGSRLDVIHKFTEARGYPDLSSIAASQTAIEGGTRRAKGKNVVDPQIMRDQVFAFDWPAVSAEFQAFIKGTVKVIVARKKVPSAKALELMGAHYKENRSALPDEVRNRRDEIVELIMEGFAPDTAFSEALRFEP
jgi:hypothetical protein